MSIHAKDQDQIERLHGLAVADIHERLITLQDASYELGYRHPIQSPTTLVTRCCNSQLHSPTIPKAGVPHTSDPLERVVWNQ